MLHADDGSIAAHGVSEPYELLRRSGIEELENGTYYWQFFSDAVRIAALAEYGGLYFDASTLHMRPIETWLDVTSPRVMGWMNCNPHLTEELGPADASRYDLDMSCRQYYHAAELDPVAWAIAYASSTMPTMNNWMWAAPPKEAFTMLWRKEYERASSPKTRMLSPLCLCCLLPVQSPIHRSFHRFVCGDAGALNMGLVRYMASMYFAEGGYKTNWYFTQYVAWRAVRLLHPQLAPIGTCEFAAGAPSGWAFWAMLNQSCNANLCGFSTSASAAVERLFAIESPDHPLIANTTVIKFNQRHRAAMKPLDDYPATSYVASLLRL